MSAGDSTLAAPGRGWRAAGSGLGAGRGEPAVSPVPGAASRGPSASALPGARTDPHWRPRPRRELWRRASFSPPGVVPVKGWRTAEAWEGRGTRSLSWKKPLPAPPGGPGPPRGLWGTRHGRAAPLDGTAWGLSRIPQPPLLGIPRKPAPLGERCQRRVVTCGMCSVSPRETGLHTRGSVRQGVWLLVGGRGL